MRSVAIPLFSGKECDRILLHPSVWSPEPHPREDSCLVVCSLNAVGGLIFFQPSIIREF